MAPTVLMTACDFGYGPAGKLDSIAAHLGDARLVLFGSRLGRGILEFPAAATYDPTSSLEQVIAAEDIDVVACVLDPDLATAAERLGTPTVYVDSLPFMWTDKDPIPYEVSAYCAQRCPDVPPEAQAVLNGIANLHWVDDIVTASAGPSARRAGTVVVNVGGVHNPLSGSVRSLYAGTVIPPLLRALAERGYREVHLTGNPAAIDGFTALEPSMRVTAGRLPHREFIDLAVSAELLITSPGLTTINEVLGRVPMVLLPAQNLSQVYNARHARLLDPQLPSIDWPAGVLNPTEVEHRKRNGGELVAVAYIGDRIAAAAGAATTAAMLHEAAARALRDSAAGGWPRRGKPWGTTGAAQIADLIRALAGRRRQPAPTTSNGAAYR